MTERNRTNGRDRSAESTDGDRSTMGDVSHTHPITGETFGGVYRRGPAVADGGATAGTPAERTGQRMKDVDHTPPDDVDVNQVWVRGAASDDAKSVDEDANRR